MKSETKLKLC